MFTEFCSFLIQFYPSSLVFGGYLLGVLRIDFLTLFPEMMLAAVDHSILGRASRSGLVSFEATNPRDFATDVHKTVDDSPYGGGAGMVLKVDIMAQAIRSLQLESSVPVIFTDPNGSKFTQAAAQDLSAHDRIAFICGHYEGVDDRVRSLFATHCFSIGDFVLTGGELPALVMADAIVRLRPGVLGAADSLEQDSHSDGLLSYPQFTRPDDFEGHCVPDVLKSGDHGAVARWRRSHALQSTRAQRPDLFCRAKLGKNDLDLL